MDGAAADAVSQAAFSRPVKTNTGVFGPARI